MDINLLNNYINKIHKKIIFIDKNINKKINNKEIKKLNSNYIDLKYIFNILNDLKKIYDNIFFLNNEINNNTEIKELAEEELKIYNNFKNNLLFKLSNFIYYKNENINNNKNLINGCFIEIRSCTGGNEASIFAEDLFKIYNKYICKNFNNITIISKIVNIYGGLKEIIIKVNDINAYERLKFESGGHRVQRIPYNDSKGKIHTSTCTIGIIPIFLENKNNTKINSKDIKIDTFRSSGAGGQHVNTTNSAIRITHIPTNIIVECQDERSQHQNKEKAMEILKYRIKVLEINKKKDMDSNIRKRLLGSGYRNDRIRTYNFVKNRIIDHRLSIKFNNLHNIINNLDIIINKLNLKYILDNINKVIL